MCTHFRIIGVQSDLKILIRLVDTHIPEKEAELSQFIYFMKCISGCVSDFGAHIAPLGEFLEESCATPGNRTTNQTKIIRLAQLLWGSDHFYALKDLQEHLCNVIKLENGENLRKSEFL